MSFEDGPIDREWNPTKEEWDEMEANERNPRPMNDPNTLIAFSVSDAAIATITAGKS